jgi:tetratricopeptide (TPR) repeat protein
MKLLSWALAILLPASGCLAADAARILDLLRRGRFGEALAASEAEVRRAPGDFQAWTLKGVALHALNRPGEALVALRKALSIKPDFLPALEGAARVEYQTKDARCEHTLKKILSLKPGDPQAHAMMAVLSFEKRDCGGAVTHFERAGDHTTQIPIARWQFAACLFEARRFGDAAAHFEALLAQREDSSVRYNLALALYENKQPAEAAAALEPLASRAVPESDVLSLLAAAQEAAGQTPKALETLRRAIEIYPRGERHYIDLAQLCLDHHSIPLGLEILAVGRKNIERSARLAVMQGVLEARSGLTQEAEKSFRAAEGMGQTGLGLLLLEMNMLEESIAVLRQQLAKDPAQPMASILLAQALLRKDNNAETLAEAKRILLSLGEVGRANAQARRLLGKIYMLEQDLAKAIPELEAALRLDPEDRSSAYQLIAAYRKTGRTKEIARLQTTVKNLLDAEREAESEAGRYRLVRAPEAAERQ